MAFQRAFARVGYSYDSEETSATSDIYCSTKQVANRGNRLEFLQSLSDSIPDGLRAKGEGEIDLKGDVTVEHIEADQFASFRKALGVSEESFLSSFSTVTGGAISDGGRSGSLYWFSKDSKYLLKSATETDMERIVDMLPRYIEHFEEAKRAGRPCLLLQFCGAYRFRCGDDVLGLICMNEVFTGQKPERIYDLKGTTHHRLVEDPQEGAVLKDLNLDTYFVLDDAKNKTTSEDLLEAIRQDGEFLKEEGCIDYSMLMGIDDESTKLPTGSMSFKVQEIPEDEDAEEELGGNRVLRLGLIDFLTPFNVKKRAEGFWKSIVNPCQEHSAMAPDYYGDRWIHYCEAKLQVAE